MDTHVKVVGWLWIVYGVVSILMFIPGLIIANLGGNIPNSQDALLVTLGLLCIFLPGIIADFLAGYGLLNYKGWARILLRPYSEAKTLLLKWKKSADHFLEYTGITTTTNLALYLGKLQEFGIFEEGK
jgi:hypothetical protein